jgi:hypothetical protein
MRNNIKQRRFLLLKLAIIITGLYRILKISDDYDILYDLIGLAMTSVVLVQK